MDKIVRKMAFARHVSQEEAMLSPEARRYLQSYTDGINAYAATHARPWPFWLVSYQPTEWTVMIFSLSLSLGVHLCSLLT